MSESRKVRRRGKRDECVEGRKGGGDSELISQLMQPRMSCWGMAVELVGKGGVVLLSVKEYLQKSRAEDTEQTEQSGHSTLATLFTPDSQSTVRGSILL